MGLSLDNNGQIFRFTLNYGEKRQRILLGYGPPENIDPLRDRFIGIVIGICIATTVFALIWPESADLSARERLAAGLRTIARLLRVGEGSNDSKNQSSQREQVDPGASFPASGSRTEARTGEALKA
jgi:hypothetical protein